MTYIRKLPQLKHETLIESVFMGKRARRRMRLSPGSGGVESVGGPGLESADLRTAYSAPELRPESESDSAPIVRPESESDSAPENDDQAQELDPSKCWGDPRYVWEAGVPRLRKRRAPEQVAARYPSGRAVAAGRELDAFGRLIPLVRDGRPVKRGPLPKSLRPE